MTWRSARINAPLRIGAKSGANHIIDLGLLV